MPAIKHFCDKCFLPFKSNRTPKYHKRESCKADPTIQQKKKKGRKCPYPCPGNNEGEHLFIRPEATHIKRSENPRDRSGNLTEEATQKQSENSSYEATDDEAVQMERSENPRDRSVNLEEQATQKQSENQDDRAKQEPPKFTRIKINRFVGDMRQKRRNYSGICECVKSKGREVACGPGSGCINFSTCVACEPDCPAHQCQNQDFIERKRPTVAPKYFGAKGWGLVAKEHIPRNSYIIEYVGELVDAKEFARRRNQPNTEMPRDFFMKTDDGYIDASEYGNDSRFINHACAPNCTVEKWYIGGYARIGFFAKADIPMVSSFAVFI